jgi:hypothetical protein
MSTERQRGRESERKRERGRVRERGGEEEGRELNNQALKEETI